MKTAVVLCALVVIVSAHPPNGKYTDRYDNTDYKEILANKRLVSAYCDCMLGVGKCTNEGKELKSHMTDALENKCAKCTDKQKEGVRYVMKTLINEYPDLWKKLCDKYDPTGKYATEYEKELKTLK